jgi:ribosome-binding factor A
MSRLRLEKLNRIICSQVSELLLMRSADPRLRKVTVTRAEVSADLSRVRICYGCWDDEPGRAAAALALERARGFVRSSLANRLKTRKVPAVFFEYDRNLDHADRINQVLSGLSSDASAEAPETAAEVAAAAKDD